jgi:hypothetical protein
MPMKQAGSGRHERTEKADERRSCRAYQAPQASSVTAVASRQTMPSALHTQRPRRR